MTGKPVAYEKCAEKPAASNNTENSVNPKGERRKYGQNLFDCGKDSRSRANGRSGGPQRERGYVGNAHEYHSSSDSSSWSGL